VTAMVVCSSTTLPPRSGFGLGVRLLFFYITISLPSLSLKANYQSLTPVPHTQGLKENRHDVQSMIQFAEEQGMLDRPLTADELFTENTRGT
ncbi:MAG: hypothetical protein ACE5JU_12970, partial [Candidatus Binatia bacterium]